MESRGEQGEFLFGKRCLTENRPPPPRSRGRVPRGRVGGDRDGPRPEPKEARTAGRKRGMRDPWKDRVQPALGVAGETAQGPQDTGDGKGTPWHPMGLHRREPACPRPVSLLSLLSLTLQPHKRPGTQENWGRVGGQMGTNPQMKFPLSWQNDSTKWKLSSSSI